MPTVHRVTATAGAVGFAAVLLLGAPADAHVRVDGDSARQGDRDAALTFDAASESTVAGIAALRVTTPAGIDAGDVALVSAPTGWTLHTVAGGYEVGGPAVPAGEDVRYVVTVARLPVGRPRLAFPTDQRYEDGRVDHWTTVTDHPAGHTAATEDHPAPILELAAPTSGGNASGGDASGGDGGATVPADPGGVPAHGAGDPTGKQDTAAGPGAAGSGAAGSGAAGSGAAVEPAGDRSGLLIGVSMAILVIAGTVAWQILRRPPTPHP